MATKNDSGKLHDAYLDLMDDTECPSIYHRWGLIAAIGGMLGRRVHIKFGSEIMYPNQYIILLGPAASRKSTAITKISKLMKKAGYENFAGDKTGSEKFISDLAAGFDNIESEELGELDIFRSAGKDSECFIKAGELEDFMGPSNGDFISLLTNLWDNPDTYKHRLKTKQSEVVYRPTVSLLGGATQQTFVNIFPPGIVGQGMLSRMLLIGATGARKKVDWPEPLDPEKENLVINMLSEIHDLEGEITVTPDAKRCLGKIYHSWRQLDDERFENYSGRRHTHLLKLCMIIAAGNLRLEITKNDVLYANTILSYTEQHMSKALGEFGHSEDSKKLYSVLKLVRKHPEGLTPVEMIKVTSQLALRADMLSAIVENLRRMDKLDIITVRNQHGEDVRKYIATKNLTDNSDDYCNFEWLQEYREEGSNLDPQEIPTDEFKAANEEIENEQKDFRIS